MKISLISNNKGLVIIALAMLLVILAVVTSLVLYNLLQHHLLLTEMHRTASRDFYNAEFGIHRAIWRIEKTDSPLDNFEESHELEDATVDIVCTYNGSSFTHTITSTVRVNGEARKTITVQYVGGDITSWD